MSEDPCLDFPLSQGLFILDFDASNISIGAELSQIQDGVEKTIAFGSYTLLPAQKKYCTTRKELLAVVRFCRQFRHYLLGRPFVVRTDHNCLTWLMRFWHLEGQLARWLEELSQFDFKIVHRAGVKHTNADDLSRRPDNIEECNCFQAGADVSKLPCGGCKYCERAQCQWERFLDDVDDVLPLAIKHRVHTGTVSVPDGLLEAVPLLEQQVFGSDEALGVKTSQIVDSSSDEDDEEQEFPWLAACNWLKAYSDQELSKLQKEDSDLAPVIEWLSSGEPTSPELYMQSLATKRLSSMCSQLEMKSGVLYYKWEDPAPKSTRLLLPVPHSLREEVLGLCHDSKAAAHIGNEKTLARLKRSFWWNRMNEDCKLYCQTCSICSKNKKATARPKASLVSYHAGYPMERVHLDVLGPFTPSENRNKYVIMMIDQFSKWVECVPVVVEKFLIHFIATFGCPVSVHTDQGSNFESQLLSVFCHAFGLAKTRTTPYHPASNGQIECQNRTLLQMIRCLIDKNVRNWDKDLQLISMALHSMVNKSTGFSANQIMLGREVVQPEDLVMGSATPQAVTQDEWVQELRDRLYTIHAEVRE